MIIIIHGLHSVLSLHTRNLQRGQRIVKVSDMLGPVSVENHVLRGQPISWFQVLDASEMTIFFYTSTITQMHNVPEQTQMPPLKLLMKGRIDQKYVWWFCHWQKIPFDAEDIKDCQKHEFLWVLSRFVTVWHPDPYRKIDNDINSCSTVLLTFWLSFKKQC